MRTNRLPDSDIDVSVVGIGCNAFGVRIDADRVDAVVSRALDEGVTFFDTADVYGLGASEELLGRALRGRRDQAVIATKFGMDMQGRTGEDVARRGSPAYVRTACEASLRRLGVDHIDLYQLHTPDPDTPVADTLGAMTELVAEGKVRAIGCSNFQAWQVVDSQWTSTARGLDRFVTAQNEYSLYNRAAEVELTPACLAFDVMILPYFPLAYGLLTGKYRRGQAPAEGTRLAEQKARFETADFDRIEVLEQVAADAGVDLLTLAIGGLAAQPAVASVIAGVTGPDQVSANARAGSWEPDSDALAALAEIGRPTMSYTTFAPR